MYIVGTVGPFGSGCSYIAKLIKERHGYEYISLSAILRELFEKETGKKPLLRNELQDFGDNIRKQKGKDFLAKQASEIISKNPNNNYVVDSIRNPGEVDFLKNNFSNFYLFGVFAEQDIRWSRVSNIYNDDHGKFMSDDLRDTGESDDFGQQVTNTFRESDIIILNNETVFPNNADYNAQCLELKKYIDTIERKVPFQPSVYETV